MRPDCYGSHGESRVSMCPPISDNSTSHNTTRKRVVFIATSPYRRTSLPRNTSCISPRPTPARLIAARRPGDQIGVGAGGRVGSILGPGLRRVGLLVPFSAPGGKRPDPHPCDRQRGYACLRVLDQNLLKRPAVLPVRHRAVRAVVFLGVA